MRAPSLAAAADFSFKKPPPVPRLQEAPNPNRAAISKAPASIFDPEPLTQESVKENNGSSSQNGGHEGLLDGLDEDSIFGDF